MKLVYSNSFSKSPSLLFPYAPPVVFSETLDSPNFATRINGLYKNHQNRSPPPLEKICVKTSKLQDMTLVSPLTLNYLSSNSTTKEKSNHQEQESSYRTKYSENSPTLTYDSFSAYNSFAKRSKEPSHSERRPSTSDLSSNKQFTKARMKYTPVRENFSLESRLYEHNKRISSLFDFTENHCDTNHSSQSSMYEKYDCKSPSSYHHKTSTEDLAKPYYRTDLKVNHLMSTYENSASHEFNKFHHQRRLSESLSESTRPNGASAFSVIRPHFNRMYSTESGYCSDPSNGHSFKAFHSIEKSEILARRNFSTSLSSGNSGYTRDKISLQSEFSPIDVVSVSKLHISDEASKEALKAFDAHVEKIMAESHVQQSHNMHRLKSSSSCSNNQKKQVESSRYLCKNSLSPRLVQCSTVDSTQTNEATFAAAGGLLGLTRIANEHLGQAIAKERKRTKSNI